MLLTTKIEAFKKIYSCQSLVSLHQLNQEVCILNQTLHEVKTFVVIENVGCITPAPSSVYFPLSHCTKGIPSPPLILLKLAQ